MAQQSGRVQRHCDRRRRHRYAPVPGTHCSSISPLHSKINDEKAQASITDQAAQYPNIAKITRALGHALSFGLLVGRR